MVLLHMKFMAHWQSVTSYSLQDWHREQKEGFKNSDLANQCKHRYKMKMTSEHFCSFSSSSIIPAVISVEAGHSGSPLILCCSMPDRVNFDFDLLSFSLEWTEQIQNLYRRNRMVCERKIHSCLWFSYSDSEATLLWFLHKKFDAIATLLAHKRWYHGQINQVCSRLGQ